MLPFSVLPLLRDKSCSFVYTRKQKNEEEKNHLQLWSWSFISVGILVHIVCIQRLTRKFIGKRCVFIILYFQNDCLRNGQIYEIIKHLMWVILKWCTKGAHLFHVDFFHGDWGICCVQIWSSSRSKNNVKDS